MTSNLNSKFSMCQSDSSNASCDSGLDDHHTLLSMCESSNVTSMDEISGLSQNSAQHQPHFKVPRLANWGNLESASTSNACSGISSSTCINDEETSDQTISPEDQLHTAKKKSEDLNQIQALLKAIIKNASGSSSSNILDTMTLKDLKSELNMAAGPPELSTCDSAEDHCSNFSLALSDSICSGGNTIASQISDETAANSQAIHMLDYNLYSTYPSKLQKLELKIICQPETQHRARYMTEGSRGAVKDRSGNGFPTLKLFGYKGEESVTLQVFIGSDSGNPAPHLFYQASKVCNKNSPPCSQRTIQGTVVIEMELPPQNDMTFVVDCVGILKERNVDVEQRIRRLKECGAVHKTPAALKVFKKRSTKCRLVFRAILHSKNDASDFRSTKPVILQVSSGPILCTQPQGVPEICRQSLTDCLCNGGSELFIIGKNFLKDTKVIFKDWTNNMRGQGFNSVSSSAIWQETITPDKDYLQPNHLICKIPPHARASSLKSPVKIQFYIQSGGKKSDVHYLTFHPVDSHFGSLFSGNNIESRLLGSTSQNHQAKVYANQAENGIFKAENLKVIHGVKVVNSKPGESSQPPVYIILPGGNTSNGQNQILPVVSSAPSMSSAVQNQETKSLNNLSSVESQATSEVNKLSNGGQSQSVQLMLVPQSFAVPVTNKDHQTDQKEPFTIKNLLLQGENFASNSSMNHSLVIKDTHDLTFEEKTSKLGLVSPLLTIAPNQTLSNLPTENLKEKYEENLNSQTMPEGVTQASLRQLNELQKQLQQDSLIQTIPSEYDSNKIQDFQSQHIQQNQQLNQVLQSQVQQIHHEQQKQLMEREIEIQRDQQRLQQVKKKMEEEHIIFQREIQQIQQERQLSLEIDLRQVEQTQQQLHIPVCQNLHQEQLNSNLRTLDQEHCIPHKIQLEFEKKLSPAEKQQLENGLQQIQQEQLHQELQNQIFEQKNQLQNNLQRFQQEQQIQEIQAHHQVNLKQKCIEEEMFIQQSLNKSPSLQYQVPDNSSLPSATLPMASDVNKSLWQNATSAFPNSIPAGPKLETNFFYVEKTAKTLSDGANLNFTGSTINSGQTNYASQMDTSFGNLKPIFEQTFQVSSAQINDLKTKAETISSFSSGSSSNSDAFHNTRLIRNSCNEIESMDISTPSTLCKRESQLIEATSHIVTAPVYGNTPNSLHVITDSNILPMSMETNLPPPLPVLNAAETQFLNSAENLFSSNMLPNSSTGIAQSKPVPVDRNLTILSNDIFEANILENNRQVGLLNVEEINDPAKLITAQENFLHSPVLHAGSVSSLMVLGQNVDQKPDRETKPPLMDIVVSQSDKMDTSYTLAQSSCIGDSILQPHSKDTSNSQAQLMNILQTETEMMKLFHN